MSVSPDWSGPLSTNGRLDDINNIREHMWYTIIASMLSAGWLVPGWDLENITVAFPTNSITRNFFFRHKVTGAKFRIAHRYDDTDYEPSFTRILLDRNLGDGNEDWDDTTSTKATYTVNATTNVVESIDWN